MFVISILDVKILLDLIRVEFRGQNIFSQKFQKPFGPKY